MVELFALLSLLALVVYLIRPQGVPPLVIHRAGRFHATLSPQYPQAVALVEALEVQSQALPTGDTSTLCFEVTAQGVSYLLGLTRRGGVSYVQIIAPAAPIRDADPVDHFSAIRDFSARVLVDIPCATHNPAAEASLLTVLGAAASQCGATVRQLFADGRPDLASVRSV